MPAERVGGVVLREFPEQFRVGIGQRAACLLVDLVGEFVDDHVVPVVGVGRTLQHVVPGLDQLPLLPLSSLGSR